MYFKRPHKKSRNGCMTCRQRRVKCDETGPPCENCRVRGTHCVFGTSTSKQDNEKSPIESTTKTTTISLDQHKMELKLLYQFITTTSQSIASTTAGVIGEKEIWQEVVVKIALEHDFLLHAILSLAAFHVAYSDTGEGHRYTTLGLEYQGLALRGCRAAFSSNEPETKSALFFFSCILMILALVSSRFLSDDHDGGKSSMLDNTITHIELLRGIGVTIPSEEDSPDLFNVLGKVEVLIDGLEVSLDGSTKSLLHRLEVAEKFEYQAIPDDTNCIAQTPQENFKVALDWLGRFLAGYQDILHSASALGWPILAGTDFVAALQAKNRVALLLLVMWAVSLRELGKQTWWAKDFGMSLVEEISTMVTLDDDDNDDQLTADVFAWARQKMQDP